MFAEAASGALLGAEDVHFGVNRLATPADDGHFYARPSAGYAAPHHHSHRPRQQVPSHLPSIYLYPFIVISKTLNLGM